MHVGHAVKERRLARFLKKQLVYIGVAAVFWAILLASGHSGHLFLVLLCTLCIGNAVEIFLPRLKRFYPFLKKQLVYTALAAVLWIIFRAEGHSGNLATVLVYTLCIGNVLEIGLPRFERFYQKRSFPWGLLLFMPFLIALLFPVYVLTTVVVWWVAPHEHQTFSQVLWKWQFPVVSTSIFGLFFYLAESAKKRLQGHNKELQEAVEQRTAQIALQEQELQRAREIQSSMLPKEIPQLAGFAVAGAWQPATTVSGDYYDVMRLDHHRLGICIADVVGKGVSAALLMANVQAAVRAFAADSASPAEVCRKVNTLLHENVAVGKFVSFVYGVLDSEERTFRYSNAGHPHPIVFSAANTRILDGSGAVLGVFPAWDYEDAAVGLEKGDRLLLFTDGITEAEDTSGQEFGETGVAEFVQANCSLTAKELNSRLLDQVAKYCDAQFRDDATVLVIAAL